MTSAAPPRRNRVTPPEARLVAVWWWILFWAVLLLCSLAYLGWRVWRVWQQLKAFGRELAVAEERLDEVEGTLEQLGARGLTTTDDLAVFSSPLDAATAAMATRAHSRAARSRRRAAAAPGWAKHVD
jgi:type VI protein secretion system component VasK